MKNLETDLRNKIDGLKQIISHIEEVKDENKLKITESKKKFKNIPKEMRLILQNMLKSKKKKTRLVSVFFWN